MYTTIISHCYYSTGLWSIALLQSLFGESLCYCDLQLVSIRKILSQEYLENLSSMFFFFGGDSIRSYADTDVNNIILHPIEIS